MTKYILPTLFILAAIGLSFGYINPTFEEVRTLQEEEGRFSEALERSGELQAVRDELLSQYNGLSSDELDKLIKLLPDNVDNVRLALDLDDIASVHNLQIRNVSVGNTQRESNSLGTNTQPHNTVVLSFAATGSYENFLSFLRDLESSLRIVDVTVISFGGAVRGNYDFQVSIVTYWLD